MLFLVGLPLGSWYYLREGYIYRKALLDDLRQLGQIPAVEVMGTGDTLVSFETLKGKALVIGPVDAEDAGLLKALRSIGDQFAESGAVVFALFGKDAAAAGQLEDAFREPRSRNPDMFLFFAGDTPDAGAMLSALPLQHQGGHSVVLADTDLVVRRAYDLTQQEEIRRLVEHLTIVIPSKRTPKPVVKRQTER